MKKIGILAIGIFLILQMAICKNTGTVLVGVISQPASGSLKSSYYLPSKTHLYLPTSYTRWVEQTGAMPVIIPYNLPLENFKTLIESLDIFLLPGGGSKLFTPDGKKTLYQERLEMILDSAVARNQKGENVVVHGTCQGFQQMGIWGLDQPGGKGGAGNEFLICDLNDHESHPIIRGPDLAQSKIFSQMKQDIVNAGFDNGNLYYSHHCRFKVQDFKDKVGDVFYLTGTSKDDQGNEFVAQFEHKKYPLFATQYHPEKTQFERGHSLANLPRDPQTIRFVRDYVDALVEKVRAQSKNISDYPGFLKGYFATYHTYMIHPGNYFENSYTVQSFQVESDQSLDQMDS